MVNLIAIGGLRAKSTKQLCTKRRELLNDIISKSEEHFGLTAEVGYALTGSLNALLSLLHRAWTF
jgi:hypothetical protein